MTKEELLRQLAELFAKLPPEKRDAFIAGFSLGQMLAEAKPAEQGAAT